MDQNRLENRKRCAGNVRRCFIAIAVASGLTRDLELTWDGGHEFPNVFTDPHLAEFHARGVVIREPITDVAILGSWRTDEVLSIIRRAVEALLNYQIQH